MRRNGDEEIRDLERRALTGDSDARRKLAQERERRGTGLMVRVEALLEAANAATDRENVRRGYTVGRERGDVDFGRLTIEDVAQVAAAVLTSPSERESLPADWPGTAFAWVAGPSRADVIPDEDWLLEDERSFRTHAIAVALPGGDFTIAVASTSLTSRGRPRDFNYYIPSADPQTAWSDILGRGYIGATVPGEPAIVHRQRGMGEIGHGSPFGPEREPGENDRRIRERIRNWDRLGPVVGGEYPSDGLFGFMMRRDMVYEWARRPDSDRFRTNAEELQVFVDVVQPRKPTWW